jgi:hypothetical protein
MVCWWEASIGGLRGANTPCSGLSRYAMPGVLVTVSGTSTANTRGDQEAIPLTQAQARSTYGPLPAQMSTVKINRALWAVVLHPVHPVRFRERVTATLV